MTNCELYQAIEEITQRYRSSDRTLENYLSSLLSLARHQSSLNSLPVGSFFGLLSHAFTAELLQFDEGWRTQYTPWNDQAVGFAACESTLIRQVVDLHEMDEVGSLKNELRYFGIKAPRGDHWYNFDPATFLEFGIRGSFVDYEEDDSTVQMSVSDQVAKLDADCVIVNPDTESVSNQDSDVTEISWEQFLKFLWCGQSYE